MIYVRSIFVGIAAVVAATLVLSFAALLVPTVKFRPIGATWIWFNPFPVLVRWPLAWLIATITFGAGFYWEWQNVSSRDHGNLSRFRRTGKRPVASVRSDSPSESSCVRQTPRQGGRHVISRRR